MNRHLFLAISLMYFSSARAQSLDSIHGPGAINFHQPSFSARSVIIPAVMVGYGIFSLNNRKLLAFDNHIKEEIWNDHPHKPVKVDNYLQYAPAFSVYALNASGIRGRSGFKDRTIIYLMANSFMGVSVQSIKKISRIRRPDGFGTNAFPSGHTATVFVACCSRIFTGGIQRCVTLDRFCWICNGRNNSLPENVE